MFSFFIFLKDLKRRGDRRVDGDGLQFLTLWLGPRQAYALDCGIHPSGIGHKRFVLVNRCDGTMDGHANASIVFGHDDRRKERIDGISGSTRSGEYAGPHARDLFTIIDRLYATRRLHHKEVNASRAVGSWVALQTDGARGGISNAKHDLGLGRALVQGTVDRRADVVATSDHGHCRAPHAGLNAHGNGGEPCRRDQLTHRWLGRRQGRPKRDAHQDANQAMGMGGESERRCAASTAGGVGNPHKVGTSVVVVVVVVVGAMGIV